jgi:hypothetical protein
MSAADELGYTFGLEQPLRLTEGITHRQMRKILNDAADDAAETVLRLAGQGNIGSMVTRTRAQAVRAGLHAVSDDMWKKTGNVIRAGIYEQAKLAANQGLDLDMLAGMPSMAGVQLAQVMHYEAAQAVEDIISRKTNGFTLKERIYRGGRRGTAQVGQIVDKALAQQLSARQLASQVKRFYKPTVPGGASYAAMRLARTEINNAHHDTTIRMAADKPWVHGFKWHLSGSHPIPDECNDYAVHNEGLGEGVFAKGSVPSKPHPQCLCYLTHVMSEDDEFISQLANGSYDPYLEDRGVKC